MTKLVSFSAGLDSTWIMYQLMCKGVPNEAHYVRPAYFSMYNGGNSNFMEMLFSVAIVERLVDKHDVNVDYVTWAVLNENNFEPFTGKSYPNEWSPLIQQGNVIQGLAKLMHRITRRQYHSTAWLGWNKMDALENSMTMGDWSLDEYARMKNLYSELMYFQDHPGRIPPLQTPAWDKDKFEMWRELPPDIRELIQVSNYNNYEFAYDRDGMSLLVTATPCAKSEYYRSIGIEPAVAWRIRMNDGYRRFWCSQLGESISLMGLDVPLAARYRPFRRDYPQYYFHREGDRLHIRSYSAAEWLYHQADFKALQKKEKERTERAKASATMDTPAGEVAGS
ncbi:hypothetical protein pEaSNUABM29_00032 [Erwinia phage pEa_SNUABM_29]|nr:hypothetical protein pEaSNUABM29_00032 [Erwinia phage pEa_SNUABM_29]